MPAMQYVRESISLVGPPSLALSALELRATSIFAEEHGMTTFAVSTFLSPLRASDNLRLRRVAGVSPVEPGSLPLEFVVDGCPVKHAAFCEQLGGCESGIKGLRASG